MGKSILLLSEDLDYHGIAVRWGLEQLGVSADWWVRSSFPVESAISIGVGKNGDDYEVIDGNRVAFTEDAYGAIWNRRGKTPTVSARLTRTDRVVAKAESSFLLTGMVSVLEQRNASGLIVNKAAAGERINSKVPQLVTARKVGFTVPATLISNEPGRIREFCEELQGSVVVKQHIPFVWRLKDGRLALPGTRAIRSDDLKDDEPLSAAPMIYQQYIPIEHEIRVTVFCANVFAILRTRSGVNKWGFCDIKYEDSTSRAIELPPRLRNKCLEFMRQAGLVFAAFDIAISTDGGEYFLECNEAGQFLFLEEIVPEIPLLDAFCRFLASGDSSYKYGRRKGEISLAEFDESEAGRSMQERLMASSRASKVFSPFELSE
ncbi:MAG TPA: hypothetical protein VFX20_13750 [Steroidobacteraceae bacterium]|nr:hypothetical protein [Steroidobacteraceae bacterium]